jgi:hypothetical protein
LVGWPVLSLSIIHVRWDVLTKLMPDTVVCALTVKPRYYVQLGGRGFERYVIEKRYIASSLINRCKGLK